MTFFYIYELFIKSNWQPILNSRFFCFTLFSHVEKKLSIHVSNQLIDSNQQENLPRISNLNQNHGKSLAYLEFGNLELVVGFCELLRKYETSHRAFSLQKKTYKDVCIIKIFKSLKFFHFKGFQKQVISFTNKADITT